MTKKSPDAIEIMDIIRGFFYIKPNNIFSRDFCVYFYIFLRDFLYSYYIFPHDFLSKAIIKGGHRQNFNLSDRLRRPALL